MTILVCTNQNTFSYHFTTILFLMLPLHIIMTFICILYALSLPIHKLLLQYALYRLTAIICGVHTFCYCMYFLDTFVSAYSDHGIHTHNFTSKLASIPQVQHAAFSVCGHILVNVVLSDKYLWQLT